MAINWRQDNDARRRLRVALVENDKKARFADTMCEDVGIAVGRVDFNGVGESIWFSVIEEGNRSNRLGQFAALAAARWPEDAELQALALGEVSAPRSTILAPPAYAFGVATVIGAVAEWAYDPLEKILSDLQIADAAEWVGTYQSMMGRVALVKTGASGAGTGFLIGPDLLLTNWHVVQGVARAEVAPGDVSVSFDYWRGPNGLANKAVQVALAPEWLVDHVPWSAVDLKAGTTELPKPEELDFAVLRLARPIGSEVRNGAPRGWITLPREAKVAPGQSVLILQHPNGHPLRLAFDGVLAVNGNGTRVRYRTNTLPGSSGSPCFDQNWTLLALHHSGDPRLAPIYNEGIPAGAIRALLEERGKVAFTAGG